MKEKQQLPEDAGAYSGDTHPFGRTESEIPEFRTKGKRFSYWFKNIFWFHYRWHVFAGLFVAVLAIIFIHDMLTNYKPDFQYVVASNAPISDESLAEMTDIAVELFGDSNGDDQEYCVGYAMYMEAEGEMGVAMYSKLATFFVDADIRFFIFDGELLETYFDEPGSFTDLSERGYETVPDKPWLAEVTGLPILERNGITGASYYVAIQLAQSGDKNPELSDYQCFAFLDAILASP